MHNKILFIGNFLSKTRGTKAFSEEIAMSEFLNDFEFVLASKYENKFLRFCIFTPLYRCFNFFHALQTIDFEEIYRSVSKVLDFMACGSVLGRFGVFARYILQNLSKSYRNSIGILSKFYWTSIEILSKLISLRDSRRGNSRLRGFEASMPHGLAHFHKQHENMSPKNEKCCPNHVGYIKISPQWGRMHQDVIKIVSDTSLKLSKEATCSNNTYICEVFWGAA